MTNKNLVQRIDSWVAAGLVKREDVGETAAFARAIEHIYAQSYDVVYPQYKARSLIPLNTAVPAGADQHTWRQFDRKGASKIVHDFAHDFPMVEVTGDEFRLPIVSLGISYGYSIQDVRAAALYNLPLEAKKALAARMALEAQVDRLAAFGDASSTMTGLANGPNILVTGTASTQHDWTLVGSSTLTTVANILSDLNLGRQKVFIASMGAFEPDTLLLPSAQYMALGKPAISDTGVFMAMTIREFILETCDWLKDIQYWPQLDTKQGGHNRNVLYKRDPMVAELVIPQDFEQMPPELEVMRFKVACHMRYGGVKVTYPYAITYCDVNGDNP